MYIYIYIYYALGVFESSEENRNHISLSGVFKSFSTFFFSFHPPNPLERERLVLLSYFVQSAL